MSSIIGNKLKISIFGESHGEAIGVVIDGIPAGYDIDFENVHKELRRRAPGQNQYSTARKEKDMPKVLSGIFEGKTTGAPISAIIENTNTISKDYSKLKVMPRPSHADYPAMIKYGGFNDYRGGGHFSGRLTALIVFAGAICKEILKTKDIYIGSHIKSIKDIKDETFDKVKVDFKTLEKLSTMEFPTLNKESQEKMKLKIIEAKENLDSVGGIIEGAIINLPVGLGNPMFDSIESVISQMLFSIPGVKGVEFGDGFEVSKLYGSEAKDEYYFDNDIIKTYENHNGGILGGITTGMPIIFSVAIKPTSSIGQKQRTINLSTNKDDILEIEGRHDPCIVQRAVPVIECAVAISILDILLQG